MEFDFLSERENPLLNRKEIKFRVSHVGVTPKRSDIRSELVKTLKSDDKITVLVRFKPEFGKSTGVGYVRIYNSAEEMNRIESKPVLKKNFEPKTGKKEAKPKEEAKVEAKEKNE